METLRPRRRRVRLLVQPTARLEKPEKLEPEMANQQQWGRRFGGSEVLQPHPAHQPLLTTIRSLHPQPPNQPLMTSRRSHHRRKTMGHRCRLPSRRRGRLLVRPTPKMEKPETETTPRQQWSRRLCGSGVTFPSLNLPPPNQGHNQSLRLLPANQSLHPQPPNHPLIRSRPQPPPPHPCRPQ